MTNAAGPSRAANGAGKTPESPPSGTSTPAARARPQPGPTPYHETSQFKHWRYSREGLAKLRAELNEKSKEVTAKNMAAEKAAQQSLGGAFKDPPAPAAYPSVDEELRLVRFYCHQCGKISRSFGHPEVVEATAVSYIKRFYLKNSVMEWHPKSIMPTCLFLAAKTTNHPIPIDVFISKLQGFKAADVLDLEFLVAQSLGFEFWVRGAEKALRGWSLELQDQPNPPLDAIQRALPAALARLQASRSTDAEFLYSPGQIALACWRVANPELVDGFLAWKYESAEKVEGGEVPYGAPKEELLKLIRVVEEEVRHDFEPDRELKKIKEIDKRLKACTNPEKIPGTALYIKRKSEQEAKVLEAKAEKTAKQKAKAESDELVFGAPLKKDDSGPQPKKDDDPFGGTL